MAAQRHEISIRVLKNISRVSAPFQLLYDELKVTKCCTKTFCLCWVLGACAQPRRRSVRSIASCRVWNVGRPLSPPPPSLFPRPPRVRGWRPQTFQNKFPSNLLERDRTRNVFRNSICDCSTGHAPVSYPCARQQPLKSFRKFTHSSFLLKNT